MKRRLRRHWAAVDRALAEWNASNAAAAREYVRQHGAPPLPPLTDEQRANIEAMIKVATDQNGGVAPTSVRFL